MMRCEHAYVLKSRCAILKYFRVAAVQSTKIHFFEGHFENLTIFAPFLTLQVYNHHCVLQQSIKRNWIDENKNTGRAHVPSLRRYELVSYRLLCRTLESSGQRFYSTTLHLYTITPRSTKVYLQLCVEMFTSDDPVDSVLIMRGRPPRFVAQNTIM